MPMKSIYRPLSILLLMLLSACANRPMQNASAEGPPPAALTPDKEADAALPHVPLTPEILFSYLASEIAAQRGESNLAGTTDYGLAQQTKDPRLAARAALFAWQAGDLPLAQKSLGLWLSLSPDALPAKEQLGLLLLRNGKFAQSQQLITTVLAAQPDDAGPMFANIARILPTVADKAGASRMVDSLAAAYPALPEAHFAVIVAASGVADGARIDSAFDTLARLAPKWDPPVAWRTDQLRKTNIAQAILFLRKELARRPDASLELKMALPRLLVSDKQYPQAREAFEALLSRYPKQPELLYACGLLAFQLNDLPTARHDLEAALEAHYPDPDFIRFSLGQIAENQNDNVRAREWYLQVGEGVQYVPAQTRLAYLDAEAGQPQAGLDRLAQIKGVDEQNLELVLARSELARQAKRPNLALAALNQALKHNPQQPALLYERALIFDSLKNTALAERDLRTLLKLEPDNQLAMNALGYILTTRTRHYQEAYQLIEMALKREPDNPMIIDSMGWVLYKLDRGQEALPYLERAYSLMPDPEVAAHYGEVLWSLGQQGAAKEIWNKARQAAGEYPELDETMKRLMVQ